MGKDECLRLILIAHRRLSLVHLALWMAFSKRKNHGCLIALTFAIYVFYDAARFLVVSVDQYLASFLFLIASASILFAFDVTR